MALYNNGFPVTYPQFYYPQMPVMQTPSQMQQTPQQVQSAQQTLTPPTIHADIVQVDNEQAAANFPVGAGASQMMIAKDDSAIFVKSAMPNGQVMLDVFVKRPPAPPKPEYNLDNFVTREELDERLASLVSAKRAGREKEASE